MWTGNRKMIPVTGIRAHRKYYKTQKGMLYQNADINTGSKGKPGSINRII